MYLRVINLIPRIVFPYKSLVTNGQLAWKQFIFPTRTSNILGFVIDLLFLNHNVFKDELGILLAHDDIYEENDIKY